MDHASLILAGAQSLRALAPALEGLETDLDTQTVIEPGIGRGYFSPDESASLQAWFARYITAREGLLETINDLQPLALPGRPDAPDEDTQLRAFVVAYAATCLLVRAGRHLVYDLATHKVTQRKLNEGSLPHRIPRKQYTQIYHSLTRPHHAWMINEAMQYADTHRAAIEAIAGDPVLGHAVGLIVAHEEALQVRVRQYLKARLRFRWHSWRRRRASAVQQALFGLFELSGSLVADVRYRRRDAPRRVSASVLEQLAALLEPGDVMVTRHDYALTNLFLPGFWPHAALHVGGEADRAALGVNIDADRAERWRDPRRVLEAKKDGVLFRQLAETLAVDAVAVVRPVLDGDQIAEALSRAATHEGKLYNFDFDFFTDDRLVCTELAYRAYDGVGPMRFELTDRAGRKTFSAEDLLDMALDDRGFIPVAVFGGPGCENEVVQGAEAVAALKRSYRAENAARNP